jgi:hypothetical protein
MLEIVRWPLTEVEKFGVASREVDWKVAQWLHRRASNAGRHDTREGVIAVFWKGVIRATGVDEKDS